MKNKKRNGNKNKKENLDERPIDGDLFCLTNTTNYYKFLKVALNYADTICLTFNGRYKEFIELEYLFRTPLVENDIRVPVQRFADSRESIDSMLAG